MRWPLVLLVGCGGDGARVDVPPDRHEPVEETLCSPLTQAGCGKGLKCGWVILQLEPRVGQIACTANGPVHLGEPCSAGGLGGSTCEVRSECAGGTCKQICNLDGGAPACDTRHTCRAVFGLFVSGDATVAGVCELP